MGHTISTNPYDLKYSPRRSDSTSCSIRKQYRVVRLCTIFVRSRWMFVGTLGDLLLRAHVARCRACSLADLVGLHGSTGASQRGRALPNLNCRVSCHASCQTYDPVFLVRQGGGPFFFMGEVKSVGTALRFKRMEAQGDVFLSGWLSVQNPGRRGCLAFRYAGRAGRVSVFSNGLCGELQVKFKASGS